VATFNFGPLAGSHMASTRIRLAGTQDVIAIAKMADGSFVPGDQDGESHHRRLRRLSQR
jgi:sulfur-oxidizing protein SoxY